MISVILTVIGLILLAYFLLAVIASVFNFAALSVLLSSTFVAQSGMILTKKWYAWLIQFPFLILYALFVHFEGWNSIPYIALLQVLVSALIFGVYRVFNR